MSRADAQRRNCSRATRPGGLLPTWRSCRSYWECHAVSRVLESVRRVVTCRLSRPGRAAPRLPPTPPPAQKPKIEATNSNPKRVPCLGFFFVATLRFLSVFAWSAFVAVYHRMSLQFCFFTRSGDYSPDYFNARRMNGDGPLFSLDPYADRVSYAPILHTVSLDPNQKAARPPLRWIRLSRFRGAWIWLRL